MTEHDQLATVAALAITGLAMPPIMALLRRLQVIDRPNHRSSHTEPVIRGGGIAVGLGAIVGLAVSRDLNGADRVGIAVAAILFAAIGLVDDVRGAGPIARLSLQAITAAVASQFLLHGLGGGITLRAACGAIVVFWLVGYVNAYNFMDGINGIAAAQALVAGATWSVVATWRGIPAVAIGGALLAAAALGFLPFNFPVARAFLGDVGSYFLGAWLAALSVIALRAGLPFEAVMAPLSLFVADTATTLALRVTRREPWYEAHRDHAYQRLIRLGWSHVRTTAVVSGLMIICALLGAVSLTGAIVARTGADISLALVLGTYVVGPRAIARRHSMVA